MVGFPLHNPHRRTLRWACAWLLAAGLFAPAAFLAGLGPLSAPLLVAGAGCVFWTLHNRDRLEEVHDRIRRREFRVAWSGRPTRGTIEPPTFAGVHQSGLFCLFREGVYFDGRYLEWTAGASRLAEVRFSATERALHFVYASQRADGGIHYNTRLTVPVPAGKEPKARAVAELLFDRKSLLGAMVRNSTPH